MNGTIKAKLNNLDRSKKKFIIYILDFTIISVSFWVSLFIRNVEISPIFNIRHWFIYIPLAISSIFIFHFLKLYKTILRYAGLEIYRKLAIGVLGSCLVLLVFSFFSLTYISRSIPILYSTFLALGIISSRFLGKRFLSDLAIKRTNVLIFGANDLGYKMAKSLKSEDTLNVIGFIDKDSSKSGSIIEGVHVFAYRKLESLIKTKRIKKIIIAKPKESNRIINELIEDLLPFGVDVMTIPNFIDLVEGKPFSNMKPVGINDLLGRSPIAPDDELMKSKIENKNVMVTGAGGSIGSELCRQIVNLSPKTLVLFEVNEFSLYKVEKEIRDSFNNKNSNIRLIPLIGSVQNKTIISKSINLFNIDTIYHAAAYKHVPLVEQNIIESINNNIFGTLNCVEAAIDNNVNHFVLISTDKAVRPTNIMGATKRFAELILQAYSEIQSSISQNTTLCMVRFGNVLGSSGSVVPLFQDQIKKGGPITLTHEETTRFFMTIKEASQLTIQASAMGTGGDVFLLDMGDAIKIRILAERMIVLSGLSIKSKSNPDGDIEIKCTGLRPGEKIHEELLIEENALKTLHPRILRAVEKHISLEELIIILDKIRNACQNQDYEKLKNIFVSSNIGYVPSESLVDNFYKSNYY